MENREVTRWVNGFWGGVVGGNCGPTPIGELLGQRRMAFQLLDQGLGIQWEQRGFEW
jgi:hypothetical protein